MRHFLLLSLAISTLAVFAAAGKKLEDLSPAAREFLKKRENFMASLAAELQQLLNRYPAGKEYAEYIKQVEAVNDKNKSLPIRSRLPPPRRPESTIEVDRAYRKLGGEQKTKIDNFNGSNPTAFNELFDNGFIQK
ncbi:hypothetical protein PRIPAC_79561 [Pristionchus pacificus]|uniref:Uncharacterized protein n=1 Tax=Pristionchus pacificus TaxID=54126 RepID=A0A2A6BVP7_PRIPA|nr:hypothetical protein PRIPAC_79561 [Pristionchus pacificus]|eukprot:PDM69937.1 hypothetical protein PRIPAC_49149 [Pristionchus pacificus]